MLDGEELPWVERVEHLGHTIQESLSMEGDAQRARACFMARASDVRDNLFFAHPQQKVQAIQLYCSDAYGSMLWEYDRQYSESFFKAWNIQARLAWRVPLQTHTNIVENILCVGFQSMRQQVFSRFQTFTQKLSRAPSREIRFLFNLVKADCRSVTGRNIMYLKRLCKGADILVCAKWKLVEMLPKLSPCEPWRSSLLSTFLEARQGKSYPNLKTLPRRGLRR